MSQSGGGTTGSGSRKRFTASTSAHLCLVFNPGVYTMAESNRTIFLTSALVCATLLNSCREADAQGIEDAPSRSEVVAELRKAEALRADYRVVIEPPVELNRNRSDSSKMRPFPKERIATSDGRFRLMQRQRLNHVGGEGSLREVLTWDGEESRGLQSPETPTDNGRPARMSITPTRPSNDFLDFIDNTLGLRVFGSNQRPSDVIADAHEFKIERSTFEDQKAVVVAIENDVIYLDTRVEFTFLPDKDWLLAEMKCRSYANAEDKANDQPNTVSRSTVTAMSEISGVWTPMERRAHIISKVSDDGTPVEETVSLTRIQEIEYKPRIDDSMFTIPVESLPQGSEIADGRLGITYRLGDDHIYMDGRLHRVTEPINGEIDAQRLKELMAGAVPVVDPEDRQPALKSVTTPDAWMSWGMYALLTLGIGGIGYAAWRRLRT